MRSDRTRTDCSGGDTGGQPGPHRSVGVKDCTDLGHHSARETFSRPSHHTNTGKLGHVHGGHGHEGHVYGGQEDMVTEDMVTEDIVTDDMVTEDIVTKDIVYQDIVTEDIVIEDIVFENIA